MTNPHTEELRRRMGAMPAAVTYCDASGDMAPDDPAPRWDIHVPHNGSVAYAFREDEARAIVTALNITAFLASRGAAVVLALALLRLHEDALVAERRGRETTIQWRNRVRDSAALIELLAEKGCG